MPATRIPAPPLSRWEAAIDEHFDADYADWVDRQAVAVVGDAIGRMCRPGSATWKTPAGWELIAGSGRLAKSVSDLIRKEQLTVACRPLPSSRQATANSSP